MVVGNKHARSGRESHGTKRAHLSSAATGSDGNVGDFSQNEPKEDSEHTDEAGTQSPSGEQKGRKNTDEATDVSEPSVGSGTDDDVDSGDGSNDDDEDEATETDTDISGDGEDEASAEPDAAASAKCTRSSRAVPLSGGLPPSGDRKRRKTRSRRTGEQRRERQPTTGADGVGSLRVRALQLSNLLMQLV